MLAGLEAVVIDRFGEAICVGIEQLADVREAVPLGGVLQVHHHQVVADHVGCVGVILEQPIVHVGPAIAHGGPDHWRVAPRIEHVAARKIQRQAQAERDAFMHFGHALADLRGRDQVHAALLVVGASHPSSSGRALSSAGSRSFQVS
jgi:hypothetical protein